MMLLWFIIILMGGGVVAWIANKWSPALTRWISLVALIINFVISFVFWINHDFASVSTTWLADFSANWIPAFGVSFHLAMDGLSLLMLILTFFLGIMAVITSWNEINEKV